MNDALNVVAERITDRAGSALVVHYLLDHSPHTANGGGFGRHQRGVSHKADHHALASASLVALECDDLLLTAANLTPVGNLSRINPLDLLNGKRIDGVILVHKKYKCLPTDLRVNKLGALLLCIGFLLLGGTGSDEDIGLPLRKQLIATRCGVVLKYTVIKLYRIGINRMNECRIHRECRGCSVDARQNVVLVEFERFAINLYNFGIFFKGQIRINVNIGGNVNGNASAIRGNAPLRARGNQNRQKQTKIRNAICLLSFCPNSGNKGRNKEHQQPPLRHIKREENQRVKQRNRCYKTKRDRQKNFDRFFEFACFGFHFCFSFLAWKIL